MVESISQFVGSPDGRNNDIDLILNVGLRVQCNYQLSLEPRYTYITPPTYVMHVTPPTPRYTYITSPTCHACHASHASLHLHHVSNMSCMSRLPRLATFTSRLLHMSCMSRLPCLATFASRLLHNYVMLVTLPMPVSRLPSLAPLCCARQSL